MRKGFTLIELIFVIVIIGLLAAVAVPKFVNLKQNAEAANVIKTTVDTAQQAAEAAVNHLDLEDENASNLHLVDLVKVNGRNWKVKNNNDSYYYDENGKTVAEIDFSATSREVNYSIDCRNFSDPKTQDKCAKLLGDNNTTTVNIEF